MSDINSHSSEYFSYFQGQWSNDMFNGQGSMTHASGVIYEGLWINGKPAITATKLAIKTEAPIEIIQGTPFSIEVECRNDNDDAIEGKSRTFLCGIWLFN